MPYMHIEREQHSFACFNSDLGEGKRERDLNMRKSFNSEKENAKKGKGKRKIKIEKRKCREMQGK